MSSGVDTGFAGLVPQLYDEYLVPLIFAPYAEDLAKRLAERSPARVLEIAAGTGAVTRAMAARLPKSAVIVATDLKPEMIDRAMKVGTSRPVQWQQADVMSLPFADAEFDAVVCQFGVMFFPDKGAAHAEVRRVLKPGGLFLFNTWDRIEVNEIADEVTRALATVFPDDPPRFMARTPHGYHDAATIESDLRLGGFATPAKIETVPARSRAPSPREPAIAYCQGTPLRGEIEARGPSRLAEATDVATAALARRFGGGPVDARIQAHVCAVER